MAFLDPSQFSNNKVITGMPIGGGSQNLYIDGVDYSPANTALLTRQIIAQDSNVSKAVGTVTSSAIPADLIDKIAKGQTDVTSFVRSTIQSSLGTLDKAATSLASSIAGPLRGIFNNTNDPKASTVSTQISDPVKTNLLSNKKPGATAFKIDGFEAGSQAINSANTQLGSGSGQMTGTSLTTLLNRFRMDISAVKSLPGAIANSFSTQRLGGLFSGGSLTGASVLGRQGNGSILGTLLSSTLSAAIGGVVGVNSNSVLSAAGGNGIDSFLGRTSILSKLLGNTDLSSYYQTDPFYSVLDNDTNSYVNTGRSGVSATTANSIVGLVRDISCKITTQEYRSVNENGSLFGLGLILAALNGMTGLVGDLLNCSQSQTYLGQQSLGRAFGEVSGSQIDIAKSIIDKVDVPTKLYTPDLTISILSNPNLKSTDVGTLDSVFTSLGTNTKSAISLPEYSSDRYPVYNGSLIPQINTGVTDAIFKDSTLTDYFAGRPAIVGFDGNLVYI